MKFLILLLPLLFFVSCEDKPNLEELCKLCPKPTPEPEPTPNPELVKENAVYHGRHNGDRPTWYLSKDMVNYPKNLIIYVEGCQTFNVVNHNGTRYQNGMYLLKQSDVSGRHAAIVYPSTCKSSKAYIEYYTNGGGNSDCTKWDYSNNSPCPEGYYNCDCASSCGATTACD